MTTVKKEIDREGIAIDMDKAVEAFKKQIDSKTIRSGRLFDQDLDKSNLIFLDIGCGIGGHMLTLRNNGIRYIFGFDIIYKLVHIAKEEYNLQNLIIANAIRIPLRDNSVDRALLYNVIEHCSEPEMVLKEIYRVLSNNGVLYMDAPNANSMGDRIFRWGSKAVYGKTSHIQKFTKDKIEALITKISFEIDCCITHKGIFVDYPHLRKFAFLKWILKTLFRSEVNCWEYKLKKIS